MTEEQTKAFLTVNALFGSLFILCFFGTIAIIIRRDIQDLFLKYALACLIVALGLSSIMCFILTSYSAISYMEELE